MFEFLLQCLPGSLTHFRSTTFRTGAKEDVVVKMADADFGYVGGAPGKVNLYVGKEVVQRNVPQEEADARLTDLIREHGRWTDAES